MARAVTVAFCQSREVRVGFFDFISNLPYYDGSDKQVERMNLRHQFIIGPVEDQIAGAKVLDLAAHDGRWAYAFAGAGARRVVGIEGRQEMIDKFADFPDADLKARVELRCNDIFRGIQEEIDRGETYDVIGVLGIFYHIMDHYHLLRQLLALKPSLVIVDSEFSQRDSPMIRLVRERTDDVLNAIPQYPGQKVAVKGVPTFAAMELMAESLQYEVEWMDLSALPNAERSSVADYYRAEKIRRATCFLVPKGR